MQLLVGIIADKLNRNNIVAVAGCLLVCAAFGLTSIPIAAAAVIGLGNGMFHIGGGIDVLNISEKKSAALGIFVSPGALGIYFGANLGRADLSIAIPILIALVTAAGVISALSRFRGGTIVQNAPFSPEAPPKLFIAVISLFLVVCLRSYIGLSIDFPWRGIGYWGLALVCASAFGKTIGGFLFDRFGAAKTTVLTLGIASLLFLLPQMPIAGVTAILLFNMTMPITLWFVAKIIPGAKGFSFGLLTFALFLGFLPVYLGANAPPFWVFAPLSAMSLGLLTFGITRYNKGVTNG
jgi:FSR family fosmidomycin resistance protein-like MFS transporter